MFTVGSGHLNGLMKDFTAASAEHICTISKTKLILCLNSAGFEQVDYILLKAKAKLIRNNNFPLPEEVLIQD